MNIWQKVLQALIPKARSLSIGMIAEQIYADLWAREMDEGGMYWLVDIYADNNELFAVVAQGGKLYRVGLAVDGSNVTVGDFVQVEETFTPVQQSRVSVRRQADGQTRWTMIAATSVLNRVGEIDSSELFDSFIRHAEETGEYPALDFYHLGSSGDAWEFGEADYLARDGVCYIASGLFDESKPLAKAAMRAIPGTDIWGASIEFRAMGEPELIAAEPAVRIPVYRAGVNSRISLVLEADAAGHFTALGQLTEVARMNKTVEQALAKLFGEDEDALAAFVAEVDGVNRTVAESGLIHRAGEMEDETETDPDEGEGDDGPEGMPLLEIDDETVDFIVQQVAQHPDVAGLVAAALAGVTALEERLAKTETALAGATRQLGDARSRLAALEADEAEKQQTWREDLPARQKMTVTYRPRMRQEPLDGDEVEIVSDAELAEDILSKLPTY